jgi:hypothetical protein
MRREPCFKFGEIVWFNPLTLIMENQGEGVCQEIEEGRCQEIPDTVEADSSNSQSQKEAREEMRPMTRIQRRTP